MIRFHALYIYLLSLREQYVTGGLVREALQRARLMPVLPAPVVPSPIVFIPTKLDIDCGKLRFASANDRGADLWLSQVELLNSEHTSNAR